jgi:Transposase DNA-binding
MSDTCGATLEAEMASATLGDPRLSRRLGQIVGRLRERPDMSFPKAFDSAALEATYRFFGNVAVTPDGILSGHFEATQKRGVEASRVLVVHDSTTMSFRADGQRRGLGRLMKSGQSFYAHVSLVLKADGTRRPLGIAAVMTWVRDEGEAPSERLRWAQQVDVAGARLRGVADLVHVMDREADDYALFAHALIGSHRFIIRGRHDRLLVPTEDNSAKKLHQALGQIERSVEREVTLSKRVDGQRAPIQKKIHPSRAARRAKLSIGATRVTLKRPTTQDGTIANEISLNVVRVWEPDPPEGEAPIAWTLWTTEPIATPEDLAAIVDSYRARWVIEEFFKALKTGCAYETRQLEDYEGLVNALALFLPIACQLLEVRSESRRAPDAPASTVLTETELRVLRALGRKRLSETPSLREALFAVAALGGHIKYSGEPGWLTLARGFVELRLLTRGWEAAELQPPRDQR